MKRPDILVYHHYRDFLRDFVSFMKSEDSTFTLARLAKDSGVSAAYMTYILKGQRRLTEKAVSKLSPHLDLSATEQIYLRCLCVLVDSSDHGEKFRAMEQIQGLRNYRRTNPKESEVFHYLSSWYNVAIREMASLPDFRMDPEWIQKNLWSRVVLNDISQALEFLVEHGFLQPTDDGRAVSPEKRLECMDQIYRTAMAKYHQQMFSLATDAIDKVPFEQKTITGHTMAFSSKRFQEIKDLMDETLSKLVKISESEKNPDAVYQISLLGFALTNLSEGAESGS